jgi:hypothetical protein
MNLQLKKFDISVVRDSSVTLFIGKRGSGKSSLVRQLLFNKRHLPLGTVISHTEGCNRFYGDFVPSILIHEEYKPEIVNNAVNRQILYTKKKASDLARYGHSSINPSAFLVLDDCLDDNSWTKLKSIKTLFYNGRHMNILFILTTQYPMGIPPSLRTNIDYIFICRENIITNRKRIYDNYAGMFPTFEIFCQVMDQCTQDYECLVIDNVTKSNKLEDQVYWFKAEPSLLNAKFQVCDQEFWELSRAQDMNDDNDEDSFDYDQVKGRRGPVINVKKNY